MVTRKLGLAALVVGTSTALAIAGLTVANRRAVRRPQSTNPLDEPVDVLIPARNEQRTIATTVSSVLGQTGVQNLRVFVLDDGLTDQTADVLDQFRDPRLTVVHAPDVPPPTGWLGKPWACQRLADLATAPILVFIDADVHLEPGAVAAVAAHLLTEDLALVSPYPRQLSQSLIERIVQPLVTWAWLATVPLAWARTNTRPSLAAANGQLSAVRADVYRSIGGHAAVRNQVLEDVSLMRAVRRAGWHTETMDGSQIASCRMYASTSALVDGYAKSLWSAFNGPVASVAVNAFLLTAFVVPAIAMVAPVKPGTRAIGAVGYAAGVFSRIQAADAVDGRTWPDALAQPVSISLFSALSVVSWWRHLRGTNQWKGRAL